MPSKSKNLKQVAPKQTAAAIDPMDDQTPEASFNDTIARNRGIRMLAAETIPSAPEGYRPTDADIRGRNLRRLASELRSEAMDALREASARDLKAELGQFAPEPGRAEAIVTWLTSSNELVARAEALLAYAKEMDQIGLSDALVFLEAENKQYTNALDHNASLPIHYRALVKLFAMRSGAISEGIARFQSTKKVTAAAPVESPVEPTPKP